MNEITALILQNRMAVAGVIVLIVAYLNRGMVAGWFSGIFSRLRSSAGGLLPSLPTVTPTAPANIDALDMEGFERLRARCIRRGNTEGLKLLTAFGKEFMTDNTTAGV